MRYNFDQSINRRDTESFKWREYPEDVLPLFVADMDFVSPEPVVRALHEYVDRGVFGYPRGLHTNNVDESPELPEIVARRMAERYRWKVQPDEIVFIPGVVPGLNLACHALASPDGAVLVQPPVYPPILQASRNAHMQRQEVELELSSDGSYVIDFDRFTAAITPSTRIFLLCNPHNPVGRVFSREELSRLAEICVSRDVVICSDEIHSDLLFNGQQHVPIASLDPAIADRTITLIAPSKTFNLAGLQCSIAIIQNSDLRKRFQAAREGLTPWVNAPGLIAARAAYSDGQEWLDQLLVYLEANRDLVVDFVRNELSPLTAVAPEGTYLAWINCREAGLGNPFDFFLREARVALSAGTIFGRGGTDFVRLNFGCTRSLLQNALERMKQSLSRR